MPYDNDEPYELIERLTVSSKERLYLEEIRNQPDSDEPRLAYADWLAAEGHSERAEFIRTQIEMAKAQQDPSHLARLEQRASELLPATLNYLGLNLFELQFEWGLKSPRLNCYFYDGVGELRTPTYYSIDEDEQIICIFRRGLIEKLEIGSQAFVGIVDALPHRSNILDLDIEVLFGDGYEGENLMWYRKGELSPIDHEVLVTLTHWLSIARPRCLTLCDVRCRDTKLIRGFLNAPGVRALEELRIGFGWIGRETLESISNAPNLEGLRRLALGAFGLDDSGLHALASSPHLGNLEELFVRSDDHYDPSDSCKGCGSGWRDVEDRFGRVPGFKLELRIDLDADEEMYAYDETFVHHEDQKFVVVEDLDDEE